MTRRSWKLVFISTLGVLMLGFMAPAPAFAQASPTTTTSAAATTSVPSTSIAAQCTALYSVDCHQSYPDPAAVTQCMNSGYDPPLTCRQPKGVTVGGSRGFGISNVVAPENSAGAVGAPPTVSSDVIRKAAGKTPWTGYPCTIPGGFNICKWDLSNGKTPVTTPAPVSTTNTLCPAKDDTTGFYGTKSTLATGSSSFVCGAALPLSTYEITLNTSPNRVASTEYGSYYIWLYTAAGSGGFQLASGSPLKLPSYLCHSGIKTVDLTAPIAQMITYSSSTKSITLRLLPRSTLDTSVTPSPIPPYTAGETEKFLILPLVGGVPQIPADCADDTTYYKESSSSSADLVIESAVNDGCEGSTTQCSTATTAPVPSQSCITVTLLPTGTVGSTVCDGKTQYAILDRPNLVYAPNSAPTMRAMEGRTALLAPSLTGSKIYLQTNSILRIGKTAPAFTLNEGGNVTLADGTRVTLSAPATIDMANSRILLTGGGRHLSAGGILLQEYAANYTLSVSDAVIEVNPALSINLPPGYLIPTQPTPYAQLPHDK